MLSQKRHHSFGSNTSLFTKKSGFVQTTIDTYAPEDRTGSIKQYNEANLQMDCADLCIAHALSYNLCEQPKFKRIFRLAKTVDSNFKPPNRNLISGDLLNINFDLCQKQNIKNLTKEANIFGISFFGDGTTVKRVTLLNILGSAANMPPVVLEIHDFTDHMASGHKKDSPYIVNIFLHHINTHDPIKNITDLLFFDGARNVQKAGKIIEATYPGTTCIHGAEHSVSLFFSDITKIPPIKVSLYTSLYDTNMFFNVNQLTIYFLLDINIHSIGTNFES